MAYRLPDQRKRLLVGQHLRCVLDGSGGQEIACLTLCCEQRLHFLAQVAIISAGSHEERYTLIRTEPESLLIKPADLLPSFRSHSRLPDSALDTTTRAPGSSHAARSAVRL